MNGQRKKREQMSMRVKDSERNVMTEPARVKSRWSEYFEQLLNVDDGRRAELTEVRG